MIIPKEIIVHELNTEQLWKYFRIIKNNNLINEETFNKVKRGIKIEFDILNYIYTESGIMTNIHLDFINQTAYTNNQQQSKLPLIDFLNEIDERKCIMMDVLLNVQNQSNIADRD